MAYEYDVAFSFLAQDESLATELNDLLQDRVHTFLYSKRQERLAGKDGEEAFNTVFGEQARMVVVLYRAGWGESPWTRIEQTAIRNRAYEQGYDFVKFIPLDDPPTVPNWLPRTQIWVGLARWGVSGAAGVIEARIQELGGEPHNESVIDKAARVERSILFAKEREQFLHSYEGVNASKALFAELQNEVKHEVTRVNDASPTFGFNVKTVQYQLAVIGHGPGLLVEWHCRYANSLDGAKLDVSLWRGQPPWPGLTFWDPPQRLHEQSFEFDLEVSGEHRWRAKDPGKRSYSSKELASDLVSYCIEQAGKFRA